MQKTYSYYKLVESIIFIGIYASIIFLIFYLFRESDHHIVPYILATPFFYLFITRVHRTCIVRLVFTDDKFIYKSFFRRLEVPYNEVNYVMILTKPYFRYRHSDYGGNSYIERIDYDFDLFENTEEVHVFPYGSTFILIGNVSYYSPNPFFTMMRTFDRTRHDYITIEYRTELCDLMHHIIDKKDGIQ